MIETKRSFCRICIASCGTLVTVDGDTVLEVRGDPDHPLSAGYLCPKGRALGEFHHDPLRINGAFVREGSSLVEASYPEALNSAADALAQVITTHGANHVGMFLGSGGFVDPAASSVVRRFRAQLGTDQNYSTATVDAISKVMVGSLMAGTMSLVPHVDHETRLVLFVGSNPVVSHGQSTAFPNPVVWLRAAMARGEVFVADPRRTETAEHATAHLALRPGTDHAMLGFLLRDVIARRNLQPELLTQPVVGFADLVESVSAYDLVTASAITGVPSELLQQLVDSLDANGRIAVVTGTGTSMSKTGNLTEWFAWALMIITDSFDRPGGMWFNPGYCTRLDERASLPPVPPALPSAPSRPSVLNVAGEWPASLLADEIESGRLKAIVVLGASVITAVPGTDRLRAALAKLDALIILDVTHNATSECATHLFGCQGQLEREDVVALDIYVPSRAQQYTSAMVPRIERHQPAWKVLAELAQKLGLDAIGRGANPDDVTTDDLLARVAKGADFAAMQSADGPIVETPAVHNWLDGRLPNGTWDLAPAPLVAQFRARTDLSVQVVGVPVVGVEVPLTLIPRRQLRRENAREFRPGETAQLLINPIDAATLHINDGDQVTVSGSPATHDPSTLTVHARVTDRIVPGAVSIPHGYATTNVNNLIDAQIIDPLSGMPHLSGSNVYVRLAS